jgi:hypothetical protein
MLDLLINQIANSDIDAFHNAIIIPENINKFIWDDTDDGYSITSENRTIYIDKNNSKVYTLTSSYHKNDYEKYVMLHELSTKYGYRIEIPIDCQYIKLDNTNFMYSVLQRPNNEIGQNYSYDVLKKRVNTEYFIKFVDDATPIFKGLYDVAEQFNTGLPLNGITPATMLRDSMGAFFYNILHNWSAPSIPFISSMIDDTLYQINYTNTVNGKLVDEDTVHNYMIEKWTQI